MIILWSYYDHIMIILWSYYGHIMIILWYYDPDTILWYGMISLLPSYDDDHHTMWRWYFSFSADASRHQSERVRGEALRLIADRFSSSWPPAPPPTSWWPWWPPSPSSPSWWPSWPSPGTAWPLPASELPTTSSPTGWETPPAGDQSSRLNWIEIGEKFGARATLCRDYHSLNLPDGQHHFLGTRRTCCWRRWPSFTLTTIIAKNITIKFS